MHVTSNGGKLPVILVLDAVITWLLLPGDDQLYCTHHWRHPPTSDTHISLTFKHTRPFSWLEIDAVCPTSNHNGAVFNLQQVCLSCQRGPPFNVTSKPLLICKPAASHHHSQLAHSTSLYHTVRVMLGNRNSVYRVQSPAHYHCTRETDLQFLVPP